MKVVLDSSVLVSAFLTRANNAGALLRAGLDNHLEICLSRPILDEVAIHDEQAIDADG